MFNPPFVGVPFVLPGFGERAVRVTGPNTLANFDEHLNAAFESPSADTVVNVSNFDSSLCGGSGGYVFTANTDYGATLPFEVCSGSLAVTQLRGIGSSNLATNGVLPISNTAIFYSKPYVLFGKPPSSTQIQLYCTPDAPTDLTNCPSGPDTVSTLYDFSSCPNLPSALSPGYDQSPYDDMTDRYFATNFALTQDSYMILAWYDRQLSKCFWFQPTTWNYGGSGLLATHVNGGPLGDPSSPTGQIAAPTVTPVTGTGSLSAAG